MGAEAAGGEALGVRAFRGAAWQAVGISTQAVLQLVVLAVLARHLAPAEFGVVAAALVFTGVLQVVGEAGIAAAVVQRPDLTPRHLRAAYWLGALVPLGLVACFWVLAPLLARFFVAAELTTLLRVTSLYVLFAGLGLISRARLERELAFERLFWVDTAAFVAGSAAGIAGALLGWGPWALAAAVLGRSLLGAVLLNAVRPPDYGFGFGRAEARGLLGFGGGYTLSRLLDYVAWQGDYLIVGRWLGLGPLGLYQRAFELMELPGRYLAKIADKVIFASMSQMQDQRARLAAALGRSLEAASLLMLPLVVWMAIAAPELVRVLYGPGWEALVPLLQLLLVTPLFRTMARVAESLTRAVGAVYRSLWRKAVAAATVLAACLVGQRWGVQGVAAGAAAAICFNALLLSQLALRVTGLGWRDLLRAHRPALWAGAAAGTGALPAVLLLRGAGAPPLAVLAASGAASLALLGAVGWQRPARFGAAGPWLLAQAAQLLRSLPFLRRRGYGVAVER